MTKAEAETLAVAALGTLVRAIGKKWDGETERRRANALSPNIEAALVVSKAILAAALSSRERP